MISLHTFTLFPVSLGFYEDVYIRRDAMMTNSHFDETDGTWVWDYQTDDETHHLFMDIGEFAILRCNTTTGVVM